MEEEITIFKPQFESDNEQIPYDDVAFQNQSFKVESVDAATNTDFYLINEDLPTLLRKSRKKKFDTFYANQQTDYQKDHYFYKTHLKRSKIESKVEEEVKMSKG